MKEDQIRNLKILLQRLDIVRDKISARNESKEKFNIFACLMATLTQTTFQQTYMEIASIDIR